jgi:hypothetical protein
MTLEEKRAIFEALQEEIESAIKQYEKATQETIAGIKMIREGERVAVVLFPSPTPVSVVG